MKLWVLALTLITLVFAATVWPTLYRHDILKAGESQVIVKTNRFTGKSWMFHPQAGWFEPGK